MVFVVVLVFCLVWFVVFGIIFLTQAYNLVSLPQESMKMLEMNKPTTG